MQRLSKRAIASRANGAKSQGPKTPTGRRRSSANSLRHGILAQSILLPGESKEVFGQLFDEHLNKLNPADGVEYAVVEEVTSAVWRLRRIWDIEATLFARAMERSTSTTDADRAADAFTSLGAGNQLQLLDRYETRLHRMHQRSLNTLKQLRDVPNIQPHAEPNEPVLPVSEPLEPPVDDELPNEPRPDLTSSNSSELPAIIPAKETAVSESAASQPQVQDQPAQPSADLSRSQMQTDCVPLPEITLTPLDLAKK